jgi:two-component system, cell cycle sensor histidine kinase and response regulator CckA
LETILVVDDEASVRTVVEEMLKGYRILTAPNTEEAMRVSTSYAGPIHLLLTDVVMPGRVVASWRGSSAFSGPR